ncbi:MAG TPA: 2-dehydro-3-deoxygalactonokinase [Rhizomicrobium sp.]|nr:2-dehydro-3-deoxygalactonokinase [Rhizomicrobium sp.]
MSRPAFIGGDWGTSRLRLSLCDADGAVLARADGPGVAEAGARAAEIFADLTADWDRSLPAILSGMVGSTIGWREAPYVACPVAPDAIARAALRFEADGRQVAIIPGLSCRNASGLFDVMRGEETQLLGALRLKPELGRGRHLFGLPGTHAKWVLVEDGTVVNFQSALSGELFALLGAHSVLARGAGPVRGEHPAFTEGLNVARSQTQAGLLHLLFSTRSRQLAGEIPKEEAASYLSGLVIGEDVAGATRLFQPQGSVTLVCAPDLGALYARALCAYGLSAAAMAGDDAALAGLAFLHSKLPISNLFGA